MSRHNRAVVLTALPDAELVADLFSVVSREVPEPSDGEVLTQTRYLSLDPVMRLRMLNEKKSGRSRSVGAVVAGRTIDVVVRSRDDRFAVGDVVLGWSGWQEYAAQPAQSLERLDDPTRSPWVWLGALGRPGITAWLGIAHVLDVAADDTVVVSSAAGAVGSVAAQLARHRGARVVGIAGGPQKCAWLTEHAHLDAAVNHRAADFESQLAAALPNGATALFENVGGAVMDASLAQLRPHARIALCGLISQYQAEAPYAYRNFPQLLENGVSLRAFRIDDHVDLHPLAVAELRAAWQAGRLATHETVNEGLDRAPHALIDLLAGDGFGKHYVRVTDDPAPTTHGTRRKEA